MQRLRCSFSRLKILIPLDRNSQILTRKLTTVKIDQCAIYPTAVKPQSFEFDRYGSKSDGNSYKNFDQTILPSGILAFSLFGFWGKEEEKDELNIYIHKGRRESESGNFEESDKLLHQALVILNDRKDAGKISVDDYIEKRTYVYDCLANLYLKKGDMRSGEALYKATMKGLFARNYEEKDNAIVEISMKLANIYAMQKRHAEAEAGYNYCIRTQEQKFNSGATDEDTVALWGLCVDSYARYLMWTKNYKKSLFYFEKALDICVKLRGENHSETLIVLNSLATIAVELQDLKLAEKYLLKAINCAEENKYPERAVFYVNLAGVQFQLNKYDEALVLGKKALEIAVSMKDKETEKQAKMIIQMLSKHVK